MKKLALCVLLVICFTITAQAGCSVTKEHVMYFSLDRFLAVDRVLAVSPDQAMAMMVQDVIDGNAVWVKVGTKVNEVKKYNDYICVARIDHLLLISFNDFISCR